MKYQNNHHVGLHVAHGKAATKLRKHNEAEARNELWRALSPTEQLAELDKIHGAGTGANRQRTRIANQLQAGYTLIGLVVAIAAFILLQE
jgi:hypothetical protein